MKQNIIKTAKQMTLRFSNQTSGFNLKNNLSNLIHKNVCKQKTRAFIFKWKSKPRIIWIKLCFNKKMWIQLIITLLTNYLLYHTGPLCPPGPTGLQQKSVMPALPDHQSGDYFSEIMCKGYWRLYYARNKLFAHWLSIRFRNQEKQKNSWKDLPFKILYLHDRIFKK